MAVLQRPARRGVTLIELLVVVSVGVVLLAVIIPLVKAPLRQQQIREASRQVQAYISGAQAQAAEFGLPVGIWLEREPSALNDPAGVTRMYLAKIPPLFTGDTPFARAQVFEIRQRLPSPPNPPNSTVRVGYKAWFDDGANSSSAAFRIEAGDLIQFGGRGNWFTASEPYQDPNTSLVTIDLLYDPSVAAPPLSGRAIIPDDQPALTPTYSRDASVTYRVRKAPIKASTAPLLLPADTVVDLAASSIGNDFAGTFVGAPRVVIMFSPGGSVESVYTTLGSAAVRPTGSIHLLIGRANQVTSLPAEMFGATADVIANLRDPYNLWVSIGHTTGRVTTAENLPTDEPQWAAATLDERMMQARAIALAAQSAGGR